MLSLGRARVVFNLLKAPASLRPFLSSSPSPVSTATVFFPRRIFSTTTTDSQNDLFNYTLGRWVYNEATRQKERRLVFNVDELSRLAAESVNKTAEDVVSLSKLTEGPFHRIFIITLRDGQQVVARIPYPFTVPKYHIIASEVATIEYLRSHGFPVPKIYGYSPDSNNTAGTAYIMMELVHGSTLTDVWPSLDNQEVISVVRQLTQLESRMMSLSFPAGGSLYFTADLDKVAPGLGTPLDDKRFCVGPDVKLALWYGRRQNLDVHRGPYQTAEAVLRAEAHKELAYLKQFRRQPILPLRRERRPSYNYQQQSPLDHVENLERYLDIVLFLIPSDPSFSRFCIRHPDLQHNNIIVSKSPDSGCKVVGLIDWQHASILPMFLLAGIPQPLQNHDDSTSQSMTLPSLPTNFDQLTGAARARQEDRYKCRLAHYHYVTSTEECNQLHHAAFTDSLHALRELLFQQAGAPWEGETIDLKNALIEATEKWEELAGGGMPCPIKFDAEDLRKTTALNKELSEMERGFDILQSICRLGEEGWVLPEHYENAVEFLKTTKEDWLADPDSVDEREEVMTHWPWDDIDETEYM